jgi:hypothetical protein
MKKRLEAELISVAHRVLKLKNKSEVNQLFTETQKLYEALTVLKFYQDNFEQLKNEITPEEIDTKIEAVLDKKEEPATSKTIAEFENEKNSKLEVEETIAVEEPKIVGEIVLDEDEVIEKEAIEEIFEEEVEEKEEEEKPETPIFELLAETEPETPEVVEAPKTDTKQISLEELLGEDYNDPVFVKTSDVDSPKTSVEEPKVETQEKTPVFEEVTVQPETPKETKTTILNDKLAKGINIAFNDRIAFVKHLFADSNEDYNRVLSQLNTFTTFTEAKDFIVEIIKPDYNNWKDKKEFEDRFIEIVEKKFL